MLNAKMVCVGGLFWQFVLCSQHLILNQYMGISIAVNEYTTVCFPLLKPLQVVSVFTNTGDMITFTQWSGNWVTILLKM